MIFYYPALWWALIALFCSSIKAKPQDPNIFEDMAKSGLMIIGNMAEMVSNGALLSKNTGFELPFAKANSETQIGAGGAMKNNDDEDDDDDDDFSSEEIRRKRAVDLDTNAPCHMGTTGGGMDDVDVEEARRRLYNRLRQAAAKRAKRAKQKASKKSKTKNFTSNDGNDQVEPTELRRRKRQTEVDDLNESMTNADKDISQKAQQFAEKVRNLFDSFMNSMSDMAERIKQQFSGGGQTPSPPAATTDNEEV